MNMNETEYKRSENHAYCDALSRLPHEESTVGRKSVVYSTSVRVIDDDGIITTGPRDSRALANPVGRSLGCFAKKAKAL